MNLLRDTSSLGVHPLSLIRVNGQCSAHEPHRGDQNRCCGDDNKGYFPAGGEPNHEACNSQGDGVQDHANLLTHSIADKRDVTKIMEVRVRLRVFVVRFNEKNLYLDSRVVSSPDFLVSIQPISCLKMEMRYSLRILSAWT